MNVVSCSLTPSGTYFFSLNVILLRFIHAISQRRASVIENRKYTCPWSVSAVNSEAQGIRARWFISRSTTSGMGDMMDPHILKDTGPRAEPVL